jgi:hypothetical protein
MGSLRAIYNGSVVYGPLLTLSNTNFEHMVLSMGPCEQIVLTYTLHQFSAINSVSFAIHRRDGHSLAEGALWRIPPFVGQVTITLEKAQATSTRITRPRWLQ